MNHELEARITDYEYINKVSRIFTVQLHVMQCTVLQGLSVRLSNMWIVTKRKKLVRTFLYHMKIRSS